MIQEDNKEIEKEPEEAKKKKKAKKTVFIVTVEEVRSQVISIYFWALFAQDTAA